MKNPQVNNPCGFISVPRCKEVKAKNEKADETNQMQIKPTKQTFVTSLPMAEQSIQNVG